MAAHRVAGRHRRADQILVRHRPAAAVAVATGALGEGALANRARL